MILYALAEGLSHVSALAAALDLPQPLISRHLKVLRERGMVVAIRCGSIVHYRLGEARLIEALDLLRAVLRGILAHRSELLGLNTDGEHEDVNHVR